VCEHSFIGRKVLVIDDEKVALSACRAVLERHGFHVDTEQDPARGRARALGGSSYDLVLLDVRMPNLNGIEILSALRDRRSDLKVILITGYSTVTEAVKAVKLGAFDYLAKPFTPQELMERVKAALKNLDEHRAGPLLPKPPMAQLIGDSERMVALRSTIARLATSDAAVLIVGQTGTGKELVAGIIHSYSDHKNGPFVSVDCSALAPGLLESELFGHVKGSFSGALSAKPGLFEIAHQGTLFLDEICNLNLETQGKLLRFLESGEFRPVGGLTVKHVQFRLVTATNRNLEQMVDEGTFRPDLYFRLNVVPVELPPLQERPTDIQQLMEHFLRLRVRTKQEGVGPRSFSPAALELLQHYSWPGNVRELKNLVERLVVMVESSTIRVEHLPDHIVRPSSPPATNIPRTNAELKTMKQALREHMFDEIECAFVRAALRRNNWNVSRAARETGMLRPNFHALMRKHNIRGRTVAENKP